MSLPSRHKAESDALEISSLMLGIWETARLLSEGDANEGKTKLARLHCELEKMRREVVFYDLEVFFGIKINLDDCTRLLQELESNHLDVLEKMPETIRALNELLAPVHERRGCMSSLDGMPREWRFD